MGRKPARLGEDYERKNCLGENTLCACGQSIRKANMFFQGKTKKEKKPWNQRFEHKAARSNKLKAELEAIFKTIKHFHEITLEEAKTGHSECRDVKG